MALDYDSHGNSYETRIPIANYYKDESLLLNATVLNHWQGYNNELFAWERVKDKVVLYDADQEEMIDELSLEEFKQWLNRLKVCVKNGV